MGRRVPVYSDTQPYRESQRGLEIPVTVCSDDNRYKELVVQDTLTEDRLLTLAEKAVRYAVEEGF